MRTTQKFRGWTALAVLLFISLLSMPNPAAALSTPSLISPSNGANIAGTVVSFRWTQVTDADNYYFQLATDAGFANVVYGAWIGNYIGIDLSGFPDNGQQYYWRVAAGNASSTSYFSSAWTFVNGPSAPPATPSLSSPYDGATINGTSISFQWYQAARANNYYLQVATDSAFNDIVFGQWVGNYLGISLTGFPDNGQRYYWRVASGNALGASYFSTAWTLVNGPSGTPATPSLNSPADGAQLNGTTLAFRWHAAARANNYRLQVAVDAGFTTIVFDQWIGDYLGVDLTGFPDNGQQYYWRVAAGNTLGSGAFSSAWSLVNGPSAAPDAPALTAPADAAYVPGATVRLRWDPAPRANDYYVEVALDAGFVSRVFAQSIGNYLGVDLSGFTDDGQQYYWRVTGRNALGSGPASSARRFINGISSACAAAAGTGNGLLSAKAHIDSCFESGLAMYFLRDASRRADQNPHGHNGQMASNAAIDTHIDGIGMGQDADNVWDASAQAAAVDAQAHTGWIYDYQLSRFGLNSYDNAGNSMLSVVESAHAGACPNNAFWDGAKVTYCVGSGMLSFAAALDVAAHEWAHAVTERASALAYEKESGALNEAFSDWMGNATEHAYGESNWTVGEGVLIIRDMANPNAYQQPDTYGGAYWVDTGTCTPSSTNDYCGVHTNSGVPNKMFYLLAMGGTHNGVQVQGLGVDKGMVIGLLANRKHWKREKTTNLVEARKGMVSAAQELFGIYTSEQTQVRRAWAAVKVGSVPPVANAGADQAVASGSVVSLVGSAADQDGTVASYSWTQIAGPTVSLTNADQATASFTAPTVSSNTALVFRLLVTDNAGEEGNDSVDVTVTPPSAP